MDEQSQDSSSEIDRTWMYDQTAVIDPVDNTIPEHSEAEADASEEDLKEFGWVKTLSKDALAKLKRVVNDLFSDENGGSAAVELAKLNINEVEGPEEKMPEPRSKKQKTQKKSKFRSKAKAPPKAKAVTQDSKSKSVKKTKAVTQDVIQLCLSDSLPIEIVPMQDIIGFKTVAVKGNGRDYGEARLRMRIPFNEASVYNSERNNRVLEHSALVEKQKYSTNRAFVESAEIFASTPGNLKLALIALQTGQAKLTSKWNASFTYPLQNYVNEPNAGSAKGISCGPGIYFYLDPSSSYQYNSAQKTWVISNVINQKLIISRHEEEDVDTPASEEARQRRLEDLRQWAIKAIGDDENLTIE